MTDLTTLYRLYAGDGSLIYVGISGHWPGRMKQHSAEKAWWSDVASIHVEHLPSRVEAMVAEQRAIRDELPQHNVQGRVLRQQPVRDRQPHVARFDPPLESDEPVCWIIGGPDGPVVNWDAERRYRDDLNQQALERLM